MDFQWIAIALGDVAWISLAFILGFASRLINLPPLVGFLATGFILNAMGISSGETLNKLADLGITLLLFTVGLKLNLKLLIKPQIWAVTTLHIGLVMLVFGLAIMALAVAGISLFAALNLQESLLLAFALSFSSTVFVVKSLEDKGEMLSLHGRIAIGILVMQDLAAVGFLAASTGKIPSAWALLLLLLLPLRKVFHFFLQTTGHGELLILYGLVLALGGSEIFEMVGIKGDLGALIMGLLISSHVKSAELAKTMLGFKDLFLVGFFLSIGMTGALSVEIFTIGLLLAPFVFIKSALFYGLMTRFRLRARTSLLATFNLTNYSEFGLIVAALGVRNDWLQPQWLVIIAVALSLSFVLAAPINRYDDMLYRNFRDLWMRFQRPERLQEDTVINTSDSTIAIFGMGRVGSGAYDKMRDLYGDTVIGIDFNEDRVIKHQQVGRKVLHGDPSDADFWEKMDQDHNINLVMLTLPNLESNINALRQLKAVKYNGRIAATARFPDDIKHLRRAGADATFNIYNEAGAGFAEHVDEQRKIHKL
ncbi:MAG: cation:proton antiporter [Gammaproteobacteria bacterium]|nr:cation:proton antiporter [Gammaproteobacteria bacterium]